MNLHFEVQYKSGLRADDPRSIEEPQTPDSFVLCYNNNWNDFGAYTWFCLFYCSKNGKKLIGELKIVKDGEDKTIDFIETSFESLDKSFYSLGIELKYYTRLRETFDEEECRKILYALNDCAMYPQIKQEHSEDCNFQASLIRDLASERALREGKSIITKTDLQKMYHIRYRFFADYNKCFPDACGELYLKFKHNPQFFQRCASIIGGNGCGKTSFVRKFIEDYVKGEKEHFLERPNFSSVLLAYSTPFDGYNSWDDTDGTLSFHRLCTEQSCEKSIPFIQEAIPEIHKRLLRDRKPMFPLFVRAVQQHIVINSDLSLNDTFITKTDKYGNDYIEVLEQPLRDFMFSLSSGQLQQFLLVTFLYRYMNYDTLVFFDEPEIHLHPQAIDRFFKMLDTFLQMFESYSIIVTHSPIVVREMMGEYVFIMSRDKSDIPRIAPCGIETFGEDISYLYEKLYHYNDAKSNFRRVIKKLIREKSTTDETEIRRCIESTQSLGLNSRCIIHDICNKEEESNV